MAVTGIGAVNPACSDQPEAATFPRLCKFFRILNIMSVMASLKTAFIFGAFISIG